jgi:predicted site-specific integrase-resolvase
MPLDLAPGGKPNARGMGTDGLLIGQVAARSGVSRKALRLFEAAGILPSPRHTAGRLRPVREHFRRTVDSA